MFDLHLHSRYTCSEHKKWYLSRIKLSRTTDQDYFSDTQRLLKETGNKKARIAMTDDDRILKDRINQMVKDDFPIHDWYRFVLSYPPHLVVDHLQKFGVDSRHQVLDPFCGTGTTIVECKKLDIPSVGVEANPMAQFASNVTA